MDVKQFAEIFEEQFATSDNMLNSKRKEYAGEMVDVLHNFKLSGALQQTNMRIALRGFLTKHIISIYDMMREEELRPIEVWDEKITDAINYLILLKAVVVEEFENQELSHFPPVRPINVTFTPITEPDKDLSE